MLDWFDINDRANIAIEFHGMVFDVILFGIILTGYELIREKKDSVIRYKEEIDDFRGWDEKEAMYRIVGNIKRLNKVEVYGVDLRDCYLRNANLSAVNLSTANFTDADLTDANLGRANLTEADLSGANFTDANLTQAYLAKANLRGANLIITDLTLADLTGAIVNDNILLSAKTLYKCILDPDVKARIEKAKPCLFLKGGCK